MLSVFCRTSTIVLIGDANNQTNMNYHKKESKAQYDEEVSRDMREVKESAEEQKACLEEEHWCALYDMS
jgi:hypothetical protein